MNAAAHSRQVKNTLLLSIQVAATTAAIDAVARPMDVGGAAASAAAAATMS